MAAAAPANLCLTATCLSYVIAGADSMRTVRASLAGQIIVLYRTIYEVKVMQNYWPGVIPGIGVLHQPCRRLAGNRDIYMLRPATEYRCSSLPFT